MDSQASNAQPEDEERGPDGPDAGH
jgi:hypothetical protein